MTLREMIPEWWCKTIFSIPENCYGNYNWLDFTIFELIFSFVLILSIKWILDCLFFILGQIFQNGKIAATNISPNMLGKDLEIPDDEIEEIKGSDLDFYEDVFSLEEESNETTKKEKYFDDDIDKEIETSIVNITQKGVNK